MRIRVKVGEVEIETEGSEEFVKKEFNELEKKYILKKGNPALINESKIKGKSMVDKEHSENSFTEDEHPSLKNVIIKQLVKKEFEWVLVYSFYKSNFGNSFFTKDNIKELYSETNRTTEQRTKNITTNINLLVKRDLITAVNDDDFLITDMGKERVLEILQNKVREKDNE